MKTDGTGFEILKTGIPTQSTLMLNDGDYLYFTGCGEVCMGVYLMKTAGSDFYSFCFTESYINISTIADGWIYLFLQDPTTNKYETIRVKEDGTKERIFEFVEASDTNPCMIGFHEGWLYFSRGKPMRRLVV